MTHEATVYLIDDNEAILDALNLSLLQAGFQTETYTSGRSFLDAYAGDRCGCLVMDLCMPGMDGLAVQKELIERNIRIPIIFMSGAATFLESEAAMKAGAVGFLKKPFPMSSLFESIREALERDCRIRAAESAPNDTDAQLSELMVKVRASSLVELGAILTLYTDVLHSDFQFSDEECAPGASCLFCRNQVQKPIDLSNNAIYREYGASVLREYS